MLDLKRVLAAKPREHDVANLTQLMTPWGEALDPSAVLQEHPTPQFARERWCNLNGYWDYAITQDGAATASCENTALTAEESAAKAACDDTAPAAYDGRILVPFSPEAALSGVGRTVQPDEVLWYRRTIDAPALQDGERVLLHFQAVDYRCTCSVNGQVIGSHEGGYLPFAFDITDALSTSADAGNEVVLRVTDPSDTGTQLRGKQKLASSDIWYTAQSGIWQTVWMEIVPAAHIVAARIDANLATGGITVEAQLEGTGRLRVAICDVEGIQVATAESDADCVTATIPHPHPWSPDDPYLYTLELTFESSTANGRTTIDRVASYTALRTCEVRADENGIPRFYLNGEPLLLRGVLDQGYWPDGLMTAPADEALVFDIEAARSLGFTMIRKHLKVEAERWYYHCDHLGMLVWQDMVSGGGTYGKWYTSQFPTLFKFLWTRLSDEGSRNYPHFAAEDAAYRDEWRKTCAGTIAALRNHPSIIGWTLFNEAWGQFDARKATELARSADATRPIDATSGWYDQRAGDFFSVHNYFRDLTVLRDPLRTRVDGADRPARAFGITEFGGLTWHIPNHAACEIAYGYDSFATLEEWRDAFETQLAQMEKLAGNGLTVYVYTQLTDIEEETNGLLTYDRRINKMHVATATGNAAVSTISEEADTQ